MKAKCVKQPPIAARILESFRVERPPLEREIYPCSIDEVFEIHAVLFDYRQMAPLFLLLPVNTDFVSNVAKFAWVSAEYFEVSYSGLSIDSRLESIGTSAWMVYPSIFGNASAFLEKVNAGDIELLQQFQ